MKLLDSAQKRIEKLHDQVVQNDNFIISPIVQKKYNFEFDITDSSSKIKIQVYFGKKGVKLVVQGNQESTLYQQISSIIHDQQQLFPSENGVVEPEKYVGSDESGKGDYFGPLVVAAVYVDEFLKDKFLKLGVKDSKLLTDKQIDKIAPRIIELLDNKYSVILITPKKYNELYPKFGNLNIMLNWAHSKAIEEIYSRVSFPKVITDKFMKKAMNLSSNLANSGIVFSQITKGERYIAVAAASILARNKFNTWFKNNKPNDLKLPKGNSEEVVKIARELKSIIGEDKMGNFTKLHFKTSKKIL